MCFNKHKKINIKKIFLIAALLTIACSSASAHLIHSLHIRNPGSRGFKEVGIYSGFFIQRFWCLDPGTLRCPWLSGEKIQLNDDASNGSPDLVNFEKQFIKKAIKDAEKSSEKSGLITEVFLVNGEKVVLTAKFLKDENNFFYFDVVENNSYEANLTELSSIEYGS